MKQVCGCVLEEKTKEPLWKKRYSITLHGFAVYCLLNGLRINLSVSIVAMVIIPDNRINTTHQLSNATTEFVDKISYDQQPVRYNWSPKIQGYIIGAGYLGYVLFMIPGGRLAEIYGPRIVLIVGTFISSFSTVITPVTASVSPYFVLVIQCVRGIAQGLMLPAMAVLSANWFPKAERGFLSGLALSGLFFGNLIAGVFSSLICDNYSIGGWPSGFYIFGGFGIFISILQVLSLTSLPEEDPRISKAELKYILDNQENKLTVKRPPVPWRKILCSMPTYALLLATFGQYWVGVHFISIHATFLATILHYPITQTGSLVSFPFGLSTIVNWASSYLSSFLTVRGCLSISKVRKMWTLVTSVVYSLCLILMIFTKAENTVTIICTVIGIAIIAAVNSGVMVVALDMTPTFAGSLMAFTTTIGSLSGFVLPVVSGIITNEEQTMLQWNKFFIISIVIAMSTAIFFCIFGSAEIQSYNSPVKDLPTDAKEEAKKDFKDVELKNTYEFSNHI